MNFPDTRWTHVVRARGRESQAQAALSELCAAYYEPVRVFLQSDGRTADAARELAQEFFARLLAGNGVDGAEQARGKFRTFLLGAVKHFLAAQRLYDAREKRGGGLAPLPLESGTESAPGLQVADAAVPPDAAFDRQWALTLLDRTLQALAEEARQEDRGDSFAALTPFLTGHAEYGDLESASARMNLTAAALRVAVHRLRHRYRERLREELAQTLAPGISVEEELAALKAALRH